MPTTISEGRLFSLRLKRSAAARADAKATICPVPGGYVARIGGRMRGRVDRFQTRRSAERAVDDHYNAALLNYVLARRRPA